jgi:prepilin-type N-terminal cleavage/methylation domain-containing protein
MTSRARARVTPASSRPSRARRGLTLVELLVAVVVASVVMSSIFAILFSNQRIYAVQGEKILGQQTLRSAAEVLATELRDLSITEGDLLGTDGTLEDDEVRFRGGRSFAVVCQVLGTSPLEVVAWAGVGAFAEGDSVFVFSEGDTETSADDDWVLASVASVGASIDQCPGPSRPEVTLTFSGAEPIAAVPGVRRGAPIRGFEVVRYAIHTAQNRQPFLGRSVSGGAMEPILGPLAPTNGLAFEYLDGDGDPVVDPLAVRAIRVTLRTASAIRDQAGRPVADSLTFLVNARN